MKIKKTFGVSWLKKTENENRIKIKITRVQTSLLQIVSLHKYLCQKNVNSGKADVESVVLMTLTCVCSQTNRLSHAFLFH